MFPVDLRGATAPRMPVAHCYSVVYLRYEQILE